MAQVCQGVLVFNHLTVYLAYLWMAIVFVYMLVVVFILSPVISLDVICSFDPVTNVYAERSGFV